MPQVTSLPVDGHLVCSCPLVIINNVAISVCVQVCVPQLHFFISLHIRMLVSPHSWCICYFLGLVFFFFDCSSPSECEVVSYCGFDLHFLNDQWYSASFRTFIGH